MAAAEYLIVERESPDLFTITWWDFTGAKRVERASRLDLTQRCDVLTNPDDVPHSVRYKALGMDEPATPDKGHRVVMVRGPDGRRMPYADAMMAKSTNPAP